MSIVDDFYELVTPKKHMRSIDRKTNYVLYQGNEGCGLGEEQEERMGWAGGPLLSKTHNAWGA